MSADVDGDIAGFHKTAQLIDRRLRDLLWTLTGVKPLRVFDDAFRRQIESNDLVGIPFRLRAKTEQVWNVLRLHLNVQSQTCSAWTTCRSWCRPRITKVE